MTKRTKWVLAGSACVVAVGIGAAYLAARSLRVRVEPYLRSQAIEYLSQRFNADVDLAALHVKLPALSPLEIWRTRGRGTFAGVRGEGVELRRKGKTEPPILKIKSFTLRIDLGTVFDPKKELPLVTVDGLELQVPPKEDRPALANSESSADKKSEGGIVIDELKATNTLLVIRPSDSSKQPLEFRIQHLTLHNVGTGEPMGYEASLTNPKPPGQIESKGTFGPWASNDPGASPLRGAYTFSNADLGVFNAIAGILQSTGTFEGELSRVEVHGEAHVPDFRLKEAGNRINLQTQFEAIVDGTNGDTILKPVHAQLGSSKFITSGGVIKREGDAQRTINLDVKMTAGRLEDFLRLSIKGPLLMKGLLKLDAKIGIPPLSGKVVEKLRLKGTFDVKNGAFLKSAIQDKLDELSRRGQGSPKDPEIEKVASHFAGAFTMENEAITFSKLGFGVPGADLDLAGTYDIGTESLDFKGTVKLEAKVSQTQTGIKRWLLKPVDPFFSKEGAGTFAHIKVDGTRDKPSFGLDR